MTADTGRGDTPSPGPFGGPGEGAGPPITFDDVAAAGRTIAAAVVATPAVRATAISRLVGADLVLKLENLQLAGSFKARGAFNKLASLSPEHRRKGVIAASAGNHAQGVAFHARAMGIPATIVMPELTPLTKIAQRRPTAPGSCFRAAIFPKLRRMPASFSATAGRRSSTPTTTR